MGLTKLRIGYSLIKKPKQDYDGLLFLPRSSAISDIEATQGQGARLFGVKTAE